MNNTNAPTKPHDNVKTHTHVVLCEKLKKAGFRVFVTYYRKVKGEITTPEGLRAVVDDIKPLHELREKKLQNFISARGGYLKAVAVKDDAVWAETEVYCSDRDNFRKGRGLVSAYGQLLAQLEKNGLIAQKNVDAK